MFLLKIDLEGTFILQALLAIKDVGLWVAKIDIAKCVGSLYHFANAGYQF